MPCTFDVEGELLRFESGGIWFNASYYQEDTGSKTRGFPMGSLQSSVAEYEHRTGHKGTLAKIEAEREAWMASPEREAMLAPKEPTEAATSPVEPTTATKAAPSTPKPKRAKGTATKPTPFAKAEPAQRLATPKGAKQSKAKAK